MKRLVVFAFAFLLAAPSTFAQTKLTEGKVTYTITLPETKKGEDNMLAMAMGKEQVIYFKGKKSRIETKTQMGEVVVLSNGEDKSFFTLMNLMGQKIAMKAEETDMEMIKEVIGGDAAQKAQQPEVKMTKETKKIAGYKCMKAIVIYPSAKGEKIEGEVWFTDEIGFAGPREFKLKEIEGFPMEFSYVARDMKIKMTCVNVEAVTVADEQFVVPDDYTIKTMMEMMSGGMGIR